MSQPDHRWRKLRTEEAHTFFWRSTPTRTTDTPAEGPSFFGVTRNQARRRARRWARRSNRAATVTA